MARRGGCADEPKKKDRAAHRLASRRVDSHAADLAAARDCAPLLLGYAGAFRRVALVALDVEDLRFSETRLYVWIAAAKNDRRKQGSELCTCCGCRRADRRRSCAPSRRSSAFVREAIDRLLDKRRAKVEATLKNGSTAPALQRRYSTMCWDVLTRGVSRYCPGPGPGHSSSEGMADEKPPNA